MEMLQICDAQLSFWAHLQQSSTVDFNLLDKIANKVQKYASNIEALWNKIAKINSSHTKARTRYANYLEYIRNDLSKSMEMMESDKHFSLKNILNYTNRENDLLFDEKTVIVQISGCKADLGRILNISNTVNNTFGFTKNDLCNSSISKVMPSIIGKDHNLLIESYLKTGKSKIFNKERFLYGQHKDGYCFKIKLLVKTMPCVKNGVIRFVGMMVRLVDDFEYILTDKKGVISSMTRDLADKLGIEYKWLYNAYGLNVQLLAPNLIDVFNKRGQCKFGREGGDELQIIVPDGLIDYLKSQELCKLNSETRTLFKNPLAKYNMLLSTTEKPIDISADDLLELENYKSHTSEIKTKCQIKNLKFIINESISLL